MKPPVVKRDLVLPTGVRQAVHKPSISHPSIRSGPSEESGSTPRISLLPKCNLHTFGANTTSLSKEWTVISRFMLCCGGARQTEQRIADQTNHYADIQLESHFWSPIYFRQTRLWNRTLKSVELSLRNSINTLHSVRLSNLRDHVPNLCRDLIRTNNLESCWAHIRLLLDVLCTISFIYSCPQSTGWLLSYHSSF